MYEIAKYIPLAAREYAAGQTYARPPICAHCGHRTDEERDAYETTTETRGIPQTDDGCCPVGVMLRYTSAASPGDLTYPPGFPEPEYIVRYTGCTMEAARHFTMDWDAGEITDLRVAFGLPPLDTAPTT